MALTAQDRMVRSAEKLFAEHGIDHPSLREISRHAGQGNTRAVQYHFDNRDRLLHAILERHSVGIEQRRLELLAEGSSHDLRSLADVVIRPLLEKIGDRDNGQEYVQIAAEVVNRPLRFFDVVNLAVGDGPAMEQWSDEVAVLMDPDAIGRPLHRRSATVRFVYNEMARRAKERRSDDHSLFEEQLKDLVEAMLRAPVSSETKARLTTALEPASTRRRR